MKKILLSVSMLLALSYGAKAQDTIFSLDFSTEDGLEDWYIIDADGDDYSFGLNLTGNANTVLNGFEGGVAYSNSYVNNVGPLTPDNSLISQAFEVPAGGTGELSFKVGAQDPLYPGEHYAVYVISSEEIETVLAGLEDESTSVDDFVALLTEPIVEETLATAVAETKTFSLEDYAGQTVRVVFRHYDVTDMYILLLDDITVTTSSVAAVNDNALTRLSVFPNPATDVVKVANAGLINSINIADLNGRIVKSGSFDAQETAQVNIADLASGVYMVSVASDKGTVTKKIVKE